MEKSFPATPIELTADGQVKANPGTLYGFRIQFVGVTIGDKVEIRNGTDNTGTVIFTVTAITIDEVHVYNSSKGMRFDGGIYNDETKSSGTIYSSYEID